MCRLKIFLFLTLSSISLTVCSQQLKSGVPIEINGLQIIFNIVNKESVTISEAKFDRYKVAVSVKNNSGKSLNVRLKNFPDLSSIGADKLVEVDCVNATGAKLTAKKLTVKMAAHLVNASYLSKDKDGKLNNAYIAVIAGYYLDEGQTVQENGIFIVPTGQELDINARAVN